MSGEHRITIVIFSSSFYSTVPCENNLLKCFAIKTMTSPVLSKNNKGWNMCNDATEFFPSKFKPVLFVFYTYQTWCVRKQQFWNTAGPWMANKPKNVWRHKKGFALAMCFPYANTSQRIKEKRSCTFKLQLLNILGTSSK